LARVPTSVELKPCDTLTTNTNAPSALETMHAAQDARNAEREVKHNRYTPTAGCTGRTSASTARPWGCSGLLIRLPEAVCYNLVRDPKQTLVLKYSDGWSIDRL
jgi:hypothetical protein